MQPSEMDVQPSVDKAGVPLSGAETDSTARSLASVLLRLLDEGGRRLVEEEEVEMVELMESAHKTNQLVSVSPHPLLIRQPSTT